MSLQPKVAVVTDSTCDLDHAQAKELGIEIVPLNVHFGETVYLDQVDITTDEFMSRMAASPVLPTTSQPSVGAFEEAYRRQKERGYEEILCVTISSKLSGTFQSASIAAQNLAGEMKIEVVDSGSAAYGLGFQALRAVELAQEGKRATEIAETLRNEVSRYHIVFFVETLEHLRRGGRIGKAAQLVGTVLQLKPLLRVDEGQIVPFERTRTRGKAIKALAQFAAESGQPEEIAVLYNTTPDDARDLAQQLAPLVPEKTIVLQKVSPVIATHIGEGILGIAVKEALGD